MSPSSFSRQDFLFLRRPPIDQVDNQTLKRLVKLVQLKRVNGKSTSIKVRQNVRSVSQFRRGGERTELTQRRLAAEKAKGEEILEKKRRMDAQHVDNIRLAIETRQQGLTKRKLDMAHAILESIKLTWVRLLWFVRLIEIELPSLLQVKLGLFIMHG